jgi:hypothetical protein
MGDLIKFWGFDMRGCLEKPVGSRFVLSYSEQRRKKKEENIGGVW